MNNCVDISVIIPVYNAALLLDRCLDSVFFQKTKYDVEVVLVDDGSTDDTIGVIKRRKEQNDILLYQQENAGPAIARNKGVELAHGEYCAYLDADDWILPNAF
jgi:glycosyltransferase involved in cell wall biosynthesis